MRVVALPALARGVAELRDTARRGRVGAGDLSARRRACRGASVAARAGAPGAAQRGAPQPSGRLRAIPGRRGKPGRRGRNLAHNVQMAVLGGRERLDGQHLVHRHAQLSGRGGAGGLLVGIPRALPRHQHPALAQQRRRVLRQAAQAAPPPVPSPRRRRPDPRRAPRARRPAPPRAWLWSAHWTPRPPGSTCPPPPSCVPPTPRGQPVLEAKPPPGPAQESLHLRLYPRSAVRGPAREPPAHSGCPPHEPPALLEARSRWCAGPALRPGPRECARSGSPRPLPGGGGRLARRAFHEKRSTGLTTSRRSGSSPSLCVSTSPRSLR